MNIQSDNGLVKGLLKLVNVISFSALYFLCCIPVLTIGAATISMSVAMRKLKNDETVTYGEFLRGIKTYAGQGTLLWLIALVAIGITAGSFWSCRLFDPISWPLYLLGLGVGTLCFLMFPWMFGCAGYFETDSRHMLVVSYYLSIMHLGYTFLLVLLVYGLLLLGLLTVVVFPVIPGVILYLEAGTFNKIFSRYDKKTLQMIKQPEDEQETALNRKGAER